jgi:hypothetical protein
VPGQQPCALAALGAERACRAGEPDVVQPASQRFDSNLRKKRLMTLNHLFLIHRYKIWAVHYVSPTEDSRYQAQKMNTHGLFSDVHDEVGDVIVADVSADGVKALLAPDQDRLNALIQRTYPYAPVDVATRIP